MARKEHPGPAQDIFDEINGWPQRSKWGAVDSLESPLVFGLRPAGELTVYLGDDHHYQFDDLGRLRRGFVNGCLYRSEGSFLSELTRHRTETETILRRRDLPPEETSQFISTMQSQLRRLRAEFELDQITLIRSEPEQLSATDWRVLLFPRVDEVLRATTPLSPPIVRRR